MPRRFSVCLAVLLIAGLLPRLAAQDQKGNLTPDEIQQIRDSDVRPNDRIKLFLKFIDQRTDTLKQLAANPDASHRISRIRGKLQEFTSLCDELQDNIDTYDSAHADIRKSLKEVVEDSAKWPALLHSLPKGSNYDYSVDTAVDSANSAQQDSRQLLAEQDIFFKIHKKMRHHNGSGPE